MQNNVEPLNDMLVKFWSQIVKIQVGRNVEVSLCAFQFWVETLSESSKMLCNSTQRQKLHISQFLA